MVTWWWKMMGCKRTRIEKMVGVQVHIQEVVYMYKM
jgi:hypothetical protein